MKLIRNVISKEEATYLIHNHPNIFSLPLYHDSIIDPHVPLNRIWGGKYNDTSIFLRSIFRDCLQIEGKIVYDFTCNIGTSSFLSLSYKPSVVYGIDIDTVCLLIARYIKEYMFSSNLIYFIEGDITTEKIVTNEKDSVGLLLNLPFGEIEDMYIQVSRFLKKNATNYLVTDNYKELEDLFLQYYTHKEECGHYNIYRGLICE
jgi:hypothetical protein